VLSCVGTVPTHWCNSRVPLESFDPSLYVVEVCKPSENKMRCCPVSERFQHTAEFLSSVLTLHYIFGGL
jgi:hypothetical protein